MSELGYKVWKKGRVSKQGVASNQTQRIKASSGSSGKEASAFFLGPKESTFVGF